MPAASRAASHVVSLNPNKASECFMSPYRQPLPPRVPSLPHMSTVYLSLSFFFIFFFAIAIIYFIIFFTNPFFRPVVLASARIGFPVMLPHCSEFSYYIFVTVHCLTGSSEVPCQRFCQNKEELTAPEVIRSYLFTIVICAKKRSSK